MKLSRTLPRSPSLDPAEPIADRIARLPRLSHLVVAPVIGMQGVRVVAFRQDSLHVDHRHARTSRLDNPGDRGVVGFMLVVGSRSERDDLRDNDSSLRQALHDVVEQRLQPGRGRARDMLVNVVCADVKEDKVRLIGLQPALRVDSLLDLLDRPARVSLVPWIGDSAIPALLGPDEVDLQVIVLKQRPQQMPVAAI